MFGVLMGRPFDAVQPIESYLSWSGMKMTRFGLSLPFFESILSGSDFGGWTYVSGDMMLNYHLSKSEQMFR